MVAILLGLLWLAAAFATPALMAFTLLSDLT